MMGRVTADQVLGMVGIASRWDNMVPELASALEAKSRHVRGALRAAIMAGLVRVQADESGDMLVPAWLPPDVERAVAWGVGNAVADGMRAVSR